MIAEATKSQLEESKVTQVLTADSAVSQEVVIVLQSTKQVICILRTGADV